MSDPVNHPAHYATHLSGIEVIEITRHMNFNLGNAIKYIFRHMQKGKPRQDIEKAIWYIDDEMYFGNNEPALTDQGALIAYGVYTGVEDFLIKTDDPRKTLTDECIQAASSIIGDDLNRAVRLLTNYRDHGGLA